MIQARAVHARCLLICLIGLAATLSGCETNAATGRSQYLAMSREEEIKLGAESTPELTKEFGGKVASPELQAYITNIGQRLSQQTEADNPSLPWEFTLLDSDVINAFALPGGKVFVSRGLAEKMTNEAQMAAVIGHEIGHVTARHSNERVGQQIATVGVGALVGGIIGAVSTENRTTGAAVGAGAGAALGGVWALSYSRDQEIEADRLGMRYMERLAYDPRGAIQVQEILKKEAGGGSQMDILSTHPASDTRIAELEKRYKKYYAHTVNNPAYNLYEDRFRAQFLAKLPAHPKQTNAAPLNTTPPNAALVGERRAFVLGDPTLWCAHCAALARTNAHQPQ